MKRSININNYEEFLIDFIDGNLKDEEHAAVVLFLEQNPDIAEEFDGIADFNLDSCNIEFSNKEILKKTFDINIDNCEHYFIAAAEGDLSADELIHLDEFIAQNPDLEKDYKMFQNLRLSIPADVPIFETNTVKQVELANGEFISELDFEKLCIGYFENDLVENERVMVDSSIVNNSIAEYIFNEYSKLRFSADLDITMPAKAELKRRIILPFLGRKSIYMPAVAASLAFLVVYYIFPDVNIKNDSNSIVNDLNNDANTEVVVAAKTEKQTTVIEKEEITATVDYVDNKKLVAESEHSNNSASRIAKKPNASERARINTYTPEQIETIACCENIGPDNSAIAAAMEIKMMPPELAYNEVDSGYFLVVAPPDESAIAKVMPKGLKKVRKRIGSVFSERKAELESKNAFSTLQSIAQVAVNGFNMMTESDYSLKRRENKSEKDK